MDMRKLCFQISVVLLLQLSNTDAVCQQKGSNMESIEMTDFTNKYLLNGKTGKIFLVGTNDTLQNVVVRWVNGYFAIGTTLKGNAIGKWYLYDNKNRIREYIIFGFDGSCILYSKKVNSKGKLVSELTATTPCF